MIMTSVAHDASSHVYDRALVSPLPRVPPAASTVSPPRMSTCLLLRAMTTWTVEIRDPPRGSRRGLGRRRRDARRRSTRDRDGRRIEEARDARYRRDRKGRVAPSSPCRACRRRASPRREETETPGKGKGGGDSGRREGVPTVPHRSGTTPTTAPGLPTAWT